MRRGSMRYSRALAAAAVVVIAGGVSSCGSGRSVTCLAQGVGEVCAENSDGAIRFSGSGLQPDSAVLIEHPDLGLSVYEVDPDGTFTPAGRGVVSMIAGTPFTFEITATDAEGRLIDGEIDISS